MDGGNVMASSAKLAEKPKAVWLAMDRLNSAISNLEDAVTRIELNTVRICNPAPPADPSNITEKESACELSGMIQSNTSYIRRLADSLNSINERIET